MDYNTNLIYYRDGIMESLHDIDRDRYYHNRISQKSLDTLMNLVEAYSVTAKYTHDAEAINEADSFYKKLKSLVSEAKLRNKCINEGFYNPFDNIDDDDNINTRYDEVVDVNPDTDMKILNVKLWNNNTNDKIVFKNGRVFAGKFFGQGDVIEVCPVRLIYDKDMYSETIREFAFTIDKSKGIYAIPFGYASFYSNSKESTKDSNADYEYVNDMNGSYIKIFATRNIRKGSEIVLASDESDFANEIKPGQFKYDNEQLPFRAVKNIRIA